MTADPADQATTAKEIRDRRRVIARILEILPPALVAKATRTPPGPDGTTVIWSHRGTMIASCADDITAQFLNDAPEYLRTFSAYIQDLEASAFYDRDRRREAEARLEAVTDRLLSAASLGLKTQEGQQRLQSAISEARGHDRATNRDIRRPHDQWPY